MSDPRHELGARAEAATERWLRATGWRIVARRYRPRGSGEIDLAAVDPGGVLVAIEVRARGSRRAGSPAESVDAARITRLRRSLGALAGSRRIPHDGLRVDLVAAEPLPGDRTRWRFVRVPGIG